VLISPWLDKIDKHKLFAPSFQDLPELNINFLFVSKYEGVSSFGVFFKNQFFFSICHETNF